MPATTQRPGVATREPQHTTTLPPTFAHFPHEHPWAPRAARMMAHALRPAATTQPTVFTPELLDDLPEPARRWLGRVIRPGTHLARRAALQMSGQIYLARRWRDFTANQLLMPEAGFVWAAKTHVGRLPIRGFDAYATGIGVMRWRMLGLPVQMATGPDVTLSALDRLAAESVLLPSALLSAAWRQGTEPDTAVYAHHVANRHARSHVTVRVARDGRLMSVTMRRWGEPTGKRYQLHTFVVSFDGEYDAGSMLIPDGIHASWSDAGGEFFRANLDTVTLD